MLWSWEDIGTNWRLGNEVKRLKYVKENEYAINVELFELILEIF